MVKLVSFVVFIAAFIWTWYLFHSPAKINLETHAGIQSKFMQLIEESVKKSRPESSDFEILKMYTQKIDDNQISAHFSYKYTDKIDQPAGETADAAGESEKTSQVMSGEALLSRGVSENPQSDVWVVTSVKTGNPSIEFQQGLVVIPEGPADAASADTSAAPAANETPAAPATPATSTH